MIAILSNQRVRVGRVPAEKMCVWMVTPWIKGRGIAYRHALVWVGDRLKVVSQNEVGYRDRPERWDDHTALKLVHYKKIVKRFGLEMGQ